jgi:hypothetical protein
LATEGESRAAEAESNQACVQVQSRDSAQPFLPAYSLLCLKEAEDKSVSSANSSATAIAAPADVFEERAGIVEYDVGVPREWAEGLARLDCLAPSAGIPAHRWRRLIDNAGQFIDRWADRAAALGWDTPSVFGCHLDAPSRRYDLQGLLWCIGDGELIAITATSATIRSPNGYFLTYRRVPAPPGERVGPIWEVQAGASTGAFENLARARARPEGQCE